MGLRLRVYGLRGRRRDSIRSPPGSLLLWHCHVPNNPIPITKASITLPNPSQSLIEPIQRNPSLNHDGLNPKPHIAPIPPKPCRREATTTQPPDLAAENVAA